MRKEASIFGYIISTDVNDEELRLFRFNLVNFVIARLVVGLYKRILQSYSQNPEKFKGYERVIKHMQWFMSGPRVGDLCKEKDAAHRIINDPDFYLVASLAGISQNEYNILVYALKALCSAKDGPITGRILPQHVTSSFRTELVSRLLKPQLDEPEKGYFRYLKEDAKRLGLPVFDDVSEMIYFYVLEDPASVFTKDPSKTDPLLDSLKEEALSIDAAKSMDEQAILNRQAEIIKKHLNELSPLRDQVENSYDALSRASKILRRYIEGYLDGAYTASEVRSKIYDWNNKATSFVNSVVKYLSHFALLTDDSGVPLADYSIFTKLASINTSPKFSKQGLEDVFDTETLLFQYDDEIGFGPNRTVVYPFMKVDTTTGLRAGKLELATDVCVGEQLADFGKLPEHLDEETKEKVLEGCNEAQ